MSDNALFDNLPTSEASLIDNIISTTFIVDFGTVTAVQVNTINGQPVTVVSVQHAIELNKRGTILPPTVTPGIEVLWPSSAGLSERGSIAIGDTVLLVGFKDFVVSVANPGPAPASNQLHYCQETLRAIPLGTYKVGSTHTIDGSGNQLVIDGGTNGAARVGDNVGDAAFWAWVLAVQAALSSLGHPVTALTELTIVSGSAKVQVG
jgi:hypothetical protein